jgi:ABC-type transport system involved in multi-copper enzyme maturation permease subunit
MQRSIRLRQLGIIARQELISSFSSARALLFLVLFGLFWFWILWKLSDANLSGLSSRKGLNFIGLFMDPQHARHLFLDYPVYLSVYFLVALTTLPFFTMIAACDQTASDVNNRYIRFLLPRINRSELYMGRYIGTASLVILSYTIVTFLAAIVSGQLDDVQNTELFTYTLRIWLTLVCYSLAFTSMMAMVSAVSASMLVSLLLGIGGYFGFVIMLAIVRLQSKNASEYISYLLPSGAKPWLTSPDGSTIALALMAMLAYAIVFYMLGWLRFIKKDM